MTQNEDRSPVVTAGLETLSRGEIVAQVDRLLGQAIENICDPNTDPKAARTLTLKITIKGDVERKAARVSYTADLKLPSDANGEDQLFIRRRDAQGFVTRAEQLDLEDVTGSSDNVTPLDEAGRKDSGQ